MEREALWRQVVVAKYGSLEGGWCSNMPTGTLVLAYGNLFVLDGINFLEC